MTKFTCTKRRAVLKFPDQILGKSVKCQTCKSIQDIPAVIAVPRRSASKNSVLVMSIIIIVGLIALVAVAVSSSRDADKRQQEYNKYIEESKEFWKKREQELEKQRGER